MMRFATAILSALVFGAGLAGVAAQDVPPGCPPLDPHALHGAQHAGATGRPAHDALMAGMDRMHVEMAAGAEAEDIDTAFVCAMIPHHRGAVDMAKAIIEHGDDPWVRALAEQIVAAQEKEIADMEAWLAANAR